MQISLRLVPGTVHKYCQPGEQAIVIGYTKQTILMENILVLNISLRTLALFGFSLWVCTVNAANYFKCVGPDGGIIFSDTECPDSSEVITEKTLKSGTLTGHVENAAFQEPQTELDLEEMLLLRARLSEVLTSLNPIKIAAEEHQLSSGEWPQTLHELGFDSREMTSSAIKQLRLGKTGKIIANLKPDFGDAKLIVLSPQSILGGTQFEWECAANFSPLIMEKLPCESRKIHQ